MSNQPERHFGRTDIEFLPLQGLHRHEQIDLTRAAALLKDIGAAGTWTQPLLVEQHSSVVLDGHHRFWCACQLGLVSIPAILIEYCDPDLTLETWRADYPVTMDDVLTAARTGDLLPIKTSRHRLARALPTCKIALSALQESRAA